MGGVAQQLLGRLQWAKDRAFAAQRYVRDRHHVLSSVKHIAGPKEFSLPEDEVVLVCIGNNSSYYLPTLFDWHRRMGIAKFLYIDNASTDNSVEIACAQADTMVLRCDASFRHYEKFIRSHVTRRFVRSGWCAMLDTDELIDYAGRDKVPLATFLAHENAHGYTAVMAQMLELFPDYDIRKAEDLSYSDSVRDFQFYDLRNIDRHDYYTVFSGLLRDNTISNPQTSFLFGGIRQTVFGEYCALTKHPLIRIEKAKRPFIFPHYSNGVACSDRSILLRHYKFAGNPVARDLLRKQNGVMSDGGSEVRSQIFEAGRPVVLHSDHARRFSGLDDLVDAGLLFR